MSPYADNNQDQGGGSSGHNINSSTENADISIVVNGVAGDIGVGGRSSKPIPIFSPSTTTTTITPPSSSSPVAATSSAATVAPSNINNNNISLSSSSSSAPSLNSSSSGINTSNNAVNNNSTPSHNPSTSPPLSDIENYLNAYPTDFPELVVAACWWAESLSKMNQSIPKDNIKRFRKELITGLRDRVRGHWYPDYPERGQGYRALICEETTDRLLVDSAKKSDIAGDFRSFFKQNTTMWIDPGNVTYRHGKHYEKTLYPLNFISNNCNINNSSNGISSSSSSLNNSSNGGYSTVTAAAANNHLLHSSYNNYMNGGGSLNGSNGMPINHTPPRSNTNNGMGRVSSPSLSSAAPVFSPSSSVYHSNNNNNHINVISSSSPSISPPASPAKDLNTNIQPNNYNNNNVYFHTNQNSSKIKLQYN